jgi:diacylglycerol kinase family enzyme
MSVQPVVQLFYNPASGSYSPRRLKALACALRAEGAEVIATPSIDGAPALADEATHVCIAGGDGTIRHVAARLATGERMLPAAVYPAGTVNLLAREGGFRRSAAACASALLRGSAARPHHPVALGPTMFFACASIGPDSAAVARVSPRLKRLIGRIAYAVAFCAVLWEWPRPRLRLLVDGRRIDCEAVYIAKGRYFAGPWSFAPAARVGDPRLHVVALPRATRRAYLAFLWAMARGRDPGQSRWAMSLACARLDIEADGPVPLQADGDIVAQCPLTMAVHPVPVAFR